MAVFSHHDYDTTISKYAMENDNWPPIIPIRHDSPMLESHHRLKWRRATHNQGFDGSPPVTEISLFEITVRAFPIKGVCASKQRAHHQVNVICRGYRLQGSR